MRSTALFSQRRGRQPSLLIACFASTVGVAVCSAHLSSAEELTPPEPPPPLLEAGVRTVVRAVREAAEENRAGGEVLRGDRLTEYLVRRAARAARGLPQDTAARALLLGLGVAMDDSEMLRSAPLIGQIFRVAESDEERCRRLAALGRPTMHQRRDVAQHFFISTALACQLGPGAAETLGIAKELRDSRGATGFSFVDLAADLAGIAFATNVRQAQISMDFLAESFVVADFVPEGANWPEGIPWERFLTEYGSVQDDRFLRCQTELRRQILALPGYR